ncbi:MmcQ/YjbR family DNA-binding protein [Devosia albogilva]|uniref:MmcQ/YjbR family DNA-binding protein n=1 Tax=Devosia albogilva TaxID=429726 RepID=A0ABW5QL03_9HYPH
MNDFPPLMHRSNFEDFVTSLPAARTVRQWRDDSVAYVGERIFALLDRDPGEIWLKVSDLAYPILIEQPGIRPAPYFARARWVAISSASGLGKEDLRAYLIEAHRLVAARLTRKARLALGLEPLIAAEPQTP